MTLNSQQSEHGLLGVISCVYGTCNFALTCDEPVRRLWLALPYCRVRC